MTPVSVSLRTLLPSLRSLPWYYGIQSTLGRHGLHNVNQCVLGERFEWCMRASFCCRNAILNEDCKEEDLCSPIRTNQHPDNTQRKFSFITVGRITLTNNNRVNKAWIHYEQNGQQKENITLHIQRKHPGGKNAHTPHLKLYYRNGSLSPMPPQKEKPQTSDQCFTLIHYIEVWSLHVEKHFVWCLLSSERIVLLLQNFKLAPNCNVSYQQPVNELS